MKLTGKDLQEAISRAADGLLFPSESDYPVEAHVIPKAGKKRLRRGAFPPGLCPEGARCVTQDVSKFFAPVVETKDWYGPEETSRAERFKALLSVLKENLTGLRVYKVGDTTIDAYVLGRTSDGDIAGVHTTVVET